MLVGSVTNFKEIDRIGPLVDLVEIRLDHFDIQKRPRFPCIFTFRKQEQGGAKKIAENERFEKLEKYLELEPEYCDIEADTDPAFIEKIAQKFPKVKLIGSYHNFEETPDLKAVLQKMKNPYFSIYKIALKANSTIDMLKLMLFAQESQEPLAVMSLGEFGKPSRVIAPIMGSLLNYTSLHEDEHLHRYDVKTLLEIFHYRKLNQETLIYALIGDPVEQSPGHIFHNSRFQHNALYVKMRVRPSEVPEVFALIKQLPFGGLSVTMPLKEIVQADEVSPLAKAIGAINTMTFKNGRSIATNTDASGALNAIERHISVKGKKLSILGAGGTARAIAYEAIHRGAHVTIFNRTLDKAKKLSEFGCEVFGLDAFSRHTYDILVNTIPSGMPVPPIYPHTTVMDVVIVPKETPLLKVAKSLHCQCIYGDEMFIEQAILQQKEWKSGR